MVYLNLIKSVSPVTHLNLKKGMAGVDMWVNNWGGANDNGVKMVKHGQNDHLFS